MRKYILLTIAILLIPFAVYAWMGTIMVGGRTVASGAADPCATADGTSIFCVDPGVASAGDGSSLLNAYASLSAAIQAEETDISAVPGGYTFICISSDGTDDTTVVSIDNAAWTTDADSLINIKGGDFPADGQWDGTKYNLSAGGGNVILVEDNNVKITNLQIDLTGSTVGSRGIYVDVYGLQWNVTIDGCIIRGDNCTGGAIQGVGMNRSEASSVITVQNSIIFGFDNTNSVGIGTGTDADLTLYVYQNTITDCTLGVDANGGTVAATNNAVFNNTADFDGTITLTNNATDEGAGEGTGGVNIAATWDSTCFTTTNGLGPDWSVQDVDSPLYHAGANLSISTDIIGTSWHATTPSIGAFEL